VDLVAEYLLRCGLRHVLVEVGGELRGHGVRPDGQPWWVALEQPPSAAPPSVAPAGAAGSCQTVVALHGLAVATTGDYRRCFEHRGRRYGHTIDPRSGRPVAHALASVTVLHRTCMLADALSTAITVLGPDQGLAFATARGIAALLVCRGGSGFDEYLSPALSAMLG
jgi:FAD:protein FMN transferase